MADKITNCLILGSAPIGDTEYLQEFLQEDPFVICADGGLHLAQKCGVVPDAVVGDFDSYTGELPRETEILRLPEMKDDTDTMAAVKLALSRGCRNMVLAGVLGGRLDHTFANFCVLQYIHSQGASGQLADADTRVFFLSGGTLRLRDLKGHTVSVFPFACRSCEVTYKGLLYPLTKKSLYTDLPPMGVSNEIEEDEASITVSGGGAIVMVSMKAKIE